MSGRINTTTPYKGKAAQSARAACRSTIYRLLSLGFFYPEADNLALLRAGTQEAVACLELLGYTPLLPILSSAREALPPTSEVLERHYLETWGHTASSGCSPYEMEYWPAHVFQKSEGLADVSGFYHAFGLKVSSQTGERPDHLSLELEFMHFLAWKESHALKQGHDTEKLALCRQAQSKFLQEHLGWVSLFAQRLTEKVEGSFLATWSRLTEQFLCLEAQAMGVSFTELDMATASSPEEPPDEACASCQYTIAGEEG